VAGRQDVTPIVMEGLVAVSRDAERTPTRQTYNTQQVVRVAFTSEDADAGLPLVGRRQAPYPDGCIVRRRSDD